MLKYKDENQNAALTAAKNFKNVKKVKSAKQ